MNNQKMLKLISSEQAKMVYGASLSILDSPPPPQPSLFESPPSKVNPVSFNLTGDGVNTNLSAQIPVNDNVNVWTTIDGHHDNFQVNGGGVQWNYQW